MHRRLSTIVMSGAVLTSMAGAARGDITQAEWHSDTDFVFHVNYMPDLDQKRWALPGSGSMFCVPTSTMNLFAYAAEWGYPSLDPGPGVWQSDVAYLDMTVLLDELGAEMDTGTTGTGVSGWLNGMEYWLDGHPLTYSAYYRTETWCPTLSDAAVLTAYGAIVNICFGRYEFNPGPQPIVASSPESGHCVTVVHAEADGPNDLELWVRDPGDDDDILSQSPWAYKTYDVETKSVLQDWDEDSAYFPMDVTTLNYDPDDELIRFIHKVYALFPSVGYSFDTVALNVGPISGDFWNGPPAQTFQPPAGFAFADVAFHTDLIGYFVLATEGHLAHLQVADVRTQQMTQIATILGGTDLVVGRRRSIYVLAGSVVHELDFDGQPKRTFQLPWAAQAIAYCDFRDSLVVVATGARKMALINYYDPVPVIYDLPPSIPDSSNPSIAVREDDCAVAILVPELDDVVFGVRVPPGGGPLEVATWSQPGLDATGVAFDDRSHLLVSRADASVLDLRPGSCWWCWSAVTPSWYDGIASRGQFRVSLSRTNYDPAFNAADDIDTPVEELEQIGTTFYDCPGDFDNDQTVGVSDLLIMLGKWGPCPPPCAQDLDGDDLVGVGDLLELLALWGNVCR